MSPFGPTARQMIGAELLKLRKKRSLVILALLLTTGIVTLMAAWVGIDKPPGGQRTFENMMLMLGSYFGLLAAVLVGAEAGAGDNASGVFRDLVVTGRSRLALFSVRLPGALALFLPLMALAVAFSTIVCFLFAGSEPTPSTSMVVDYALWVAMSGTLTLVVAVGLASMLGSRPAAITGLVGWFVIASPLLAGAPPLGSGRQAIMSIAIDHFKPGRIDPHEVTTSSVTAIVVLLLWCLVACALGAWRTRTQDA